MIPARLIGFVFVVLLLQTGCATLAPTAPLNHTQSDAEEDKVDLANGQISKLERIMFLENEVGKLQERLSQLEEDIANMTLVSNSTRPNNNRKTPNLPSTPVKNNNATAPTISPYQQALSAYQNKQYQNAIRLLHAYGQNYNTPAANFLMIQSHYQLQNCESVINLGKNFQRNVPKHIKAPDALMLVANCQYKMQQKDIARNTWRYIIQAYPNSVAAGQARVKLKT